jgi:hypothetical protein
VLLPDSVTASPDELLTHLRSLAPAGRHESFDMGSLLRATEDARVRGKGGPGGWAC